MAVFASSSQVQAITVFILFSALGVLFSSHAVVLDIIRVCGCVFVCTCLRVSLDSSASRQYRKTQQSHSWQ